MTLNRRKFLQSAGLGAALIAAPRIARTAVAEEKPPRGRVSFVQVTDTHVPQKSGLERTPKVVEAIDNLSLEYDFIVHTGDVSHSDGDKALMEQALETMRFKKKTYFIPGNHDITFTNPEKYAPVFESVFGPINLAIEPAPGVRFVFFNDQPLSDRAPAEAREHAFDDLAKLLDRPMPTVFFCHAPGVDDFYTNVMHPGWSKNTMDRWTRMMKEKGVLAVLTGHFHRDEFHLVNGIPFYVCASVVGWWGRQSTFRHWAYEDGRLTYRTIYV